MKATTLCLLAGTAVPLILTGSVQAGFLGISTVSKPNEFGLLVVNVYAEFDRPGEDLMQTVGGTANNPILIEVIGGTFYNHSLGGDTAPNANLVGVFPIIAYDTFVTIGLKVNSLDFPDALLITPGFPAGITGTQLSTNESGWSVTPDDPQGDPFNPDFFAGDGRILIAQFSTADGTAIRGTMLVKFVSNGVVIQAVVSFYHVPGPGALWLLGAAGLLGRRRTRRRESRCAASALPLRTRLGSCNAASSLSATRDVRACTSDRYRPPTMSVAPLQNRSHR